MTHERHLLRKTESKEILKIQGFSSRFIFSLSFPFQSIDWILKQPSRSLREESFGFHFIDFNFILCRWWICSNDLRREGEEEFEEFVCKFEKRKSPLFPTVDEGKKLTKKMRRNYLFFVVFDRGWNEWRRGEFDGHKQRRRRESNRAKGWTSMFHPWVSCVSLIFFTCLFLMIIVQSIRTWLLFFPDSVFSTDPYPFGLY